MTDMIRCIWHKWFCLNNFGDEDVDDNDFGHNNVDDNDFGDDDVGNNNVGDINILLTKVAVC